VLLGVFLQGVDSGAFFLHGLLKTERERIHTFGLLFLREIEFIPSAMHVNDRINYTAGKGPAVGASGVSPASVIAWNRIADNAADLQKGVWNKKEYSKARGLFGRTLGLIGTGGIGREMIPRARAFGMPVVAWSRSLRPEQAEELEIEWRSSPAEVARDSDIVSVHVALKPETRGLVNAEFFAAMRPGAFFINTSRAEVADQAALEKAVREKGIRAGLDVFAGEPTGGAGTVDDPIFKVPGVIGTHHIGASTDQAQEAIAAETVRIAREYKDSGRAPNVVNLARKSPATHLLVVRPVLGQDLDRDRRVQRLVDREPDRGERARPDDSVSAIPADVLRGRPQGPNCPPSLRPMQQAS